MGIGTRRRTVLRGCRHTLFALAGQKEKHEHNNAKDVENPWRTHGEAMSMSWVWPGTRGAWTIRAWWSAGGCESGVYEGGWSQAWRSWRGPPARGVAAGDLMKDRCGDVGDSGRAWAGVRKGVAGSQAEHLGAVAWRSSSADMTLAGRGRRKPSVACMIEATVLALPRRRAARRSTLSSSSGAAAAAAGLSPWPSSIRYAGRGMGLRGRALPRTGTVSSDNGVRTAARQGDRGFADDDQRGHRSRAGACQSANAPLRE
jgi:hypothetical protein